MKKYRMMAAGVSFMSLAAAVLGVKVWGDSRKQKRDNRPSVVALTAQQQRQEEEQGISRFTHQTGLGYRTVNGEGLFAVQLQPEMPESKQPRDIALLVDTSASQAVGPLTSSIEIVRALIGQCGPEDRISLCQGGPGAIGERLPLRRHQPSQGDSRGFRLVRGRG
jgi:hypothetical protein